MDKFFILMMFVAVAAAAEYGPKDAAKFTDVNNDGIISEEEFGTFSGGFKFELKPEMLGNFEQDSNDDIAVPNFAFTLYGLIRKQIESGAPKPEESPWETAVNLDENRDDKINPGEFDKWYASWMDGVLALMKAQMTNAKGVITTAQFIDVLTYIASLPQ